MGTHLLDKQIHWLGNEDFTEVRDVEVQYKLFSFPTWAGNMVYFAEFP